MSVVSFRKDVCWGLQRDYEMMIRAGMFSEAPPSFDRVVQSLRGLEMRINAEFTRHPGTG